MDVNFDLALLVPWMIAEAHRWSHALIMLTDESSRRRGDTLSEHDARRLDAWTENLCEGDLVVHYDPGTEEGFSYVPRRLGVDHDLIRNPVDVVRWMRAQPRGVGAVRNHRGMTIERERARRPEDLERFFVERLNAGDVDGLVALYEPGAVMALPGGGTATGTAEIREALAVLVAGRPTVEPGEQQPTLRSGELALTSARFGDGVVTVEVCRRQPDGAWLLVLDQPNLR